MIERSILSRPLYAPATLRRLIAPTSIAVLGATDRHGSFGERTLANLHSFRGNVYPVNPGRGELRGRRCYPRLQDLPESPDCVVVAVPREAVCAAIDDCVAVGAGAAIIYASGFAELSGDEGAEAQERLVERARAGGLRLVGPNCSGVLNLHSGATTHFVDGYGDRLPTAGPIAIVSQSGGVGYGVLQASERGLGFGYFLTCGNSADVDVCDYLNFLAEDSHTSVITLFVEGDCDGQRLLEAGRKVLMAGKSIVVCKTGRTSRSAAIARSHTGSMVGSVEASFAAFAKCGMIVRHHIDDVVETAAFLAKARRPRNTGVGVLSTSGGLAVMAADLSDDYSLSLPPVNQTSAKRLSEALPHFATVSNPIDLTASVHHDLNMFRECLRAFAEDEAFGALAILVPYAQPGVAVKRAEVICELAESLDIPVCIVWTSEVLDSDATRMYERHPRVGFFRSMRRCFEALRDWQWRARIGADVQQPTSVRVNVPDVVHEALSLAHTEGRALTEREGKSVLAGFGIPVTQERLCANVRQAIDAARTIGFPVALKAESPDIEHKSDVGVVRLALEDELSVSRAFSEIVEIVESLPSRPRLNGILVQEMVPAGIELLVGARYDEKFGPVMAVGLGGVFTEVLNDKAVFLPPLTAKEAAELLSNLRGARVLDGFRGLPAANRERVAQMVSRFSEVVAALGSQVAEMDVNPLIVHGDYAVVVDSLIVPGRRGPNTEAERGSSVAFPKG